MNGLIRAIRAWIECRFHRCTYYEHYLAYGPADLTHSGYHAAERKCGEAQKRLLEWLDAHVNDDERMPHSIERNAHYWEKQVRA